MTIFCTITAIVAILTVLMFALAQGIDGVLLASGLTILGGLGGYVAHGAIKKKTN